MNCRLIRLPTWPQDTLSYIWPQPDGRGPKLCLCGCTSFPTNKGVGITSREEAVVDLETSLRSHDDDVSETPNGSIEKRCYHIMISHYDVLPRCYIMVSWMDLGKTLAN